MKKVAAIAACAATLASASYAAAEPVRILVAAGHKIGLAAERPLKYAGADAAKVRDVLVALGGVRPDHAFVLFEPSREQLFAAFDDARREARRHASEEVTLVFYFSGHGDRDAIHLGDDRVLLSDLAAKMAEVPSALRIAVTDACRATREKGFRDSEPFAISASMLPQATGQVWLHASSDGEAAQESDELQGAIFTHAWLSGLRGAADANNDARVTLDESFAFAQAQTLVRSAKSSGVLQKPEAVVSLHESAPVVLTETTTKLAALTLPEGRDTHFLVYGAGGKTVVAELFGLPDRRARLKLPPGRYVVHRRAGSAGTSATIAVAEGEERRLDAHDFAPASTEVLARKGDTDEPPSAAEHLERAPRATPARRDDARSELSVGYDLATNTRTGVAQGARVTYAYEATRSLTAYVGVGGERSGRDLRDTTERLVSAYGRAGVELRGAAGMLTLRAGLGGRAGWIWQSLEPAAPAQPPTGVNAAGATDRGAFALGPEALVGARLALGRSAWFVDAAATANVLFVREEDATRGIPALSALFGAGARF